MLLGVSWLLWGVRDGTAPFCLSTWTSPDVLHSNTKAWGFLPFSGRAAAFPRMVACGPEQVSTSEMIQHLSAKISRVSQHQDGWAGAQGFILVLGMPRPGLSVPWVQGLLRRVSVQPDASMMWQLRAESICMSLIVKEQKRRKTGPQILLLQNPLRFSHTVKLYCFLRALPSPLFGCSWASSTSKWSLAGGQRGQLVAPCAAGSSCWDAVVSETPHILLDAGL